MPYTATYPTAKLTLQRNLPYTQTYPATDLDLPLTGALYHLTGAAPHRALQQNLPYTAPRLALELTLQRPDARPSPAGTYPTAQPTQHRGLALGAHQIPSKLTLHRHHNHQTTNPRGPPLDPAEAGC